MSSPPRRFPRRPPDPVTVAVVSAPTALGLSPGRTGRPRGTWRAPTAYRALGVVERLGAVDAGAVEPPPYRPERDPRTGLRNAPELAVHIAALAERIGGELDAGRWPLVLGGDCSVLPGAMLALRRRGRFGLMFVDGHLDFRHPGNSGRLSALAGEDLAVVTGRGLPEHADVGGLAPYVRDGDIVALGEREGDPETADILETDIEVVDLAAIRRLGGAEAAAARALDRLNRAGLEGFWIHVDVDVLDSELMPAVDSPQPDGLRFEELEDLFTLAAAGPLAIGAELTIFDPEFDPDGALARRVTDMVVAALTAAGRCGPSP